MDKVASNQRPPGTRPNRSTSPYEAAAAYGAAGQPDAHLSDEPQLDDPWDDEPSAPLGGGLGSPGPRPGYPPLPPKKTAARGKAKKRRRGLNIPSIRLLPVTILVAFLMLSVRVTDIWRVFTTGTLGVSLNSSEAQQPPPPGGRKKGAPMPATPLDGAPAASTAPASTAGATKAGEATKLAAAPDAPPAVPSQSSGEGEPPTFTQNELDVLQKLAERREALDARDRDLTLRENLVKAAEERINKKIDEMKGMQASVEGMLKKVDEEDDAKLRSLAKMYESMKPKDAGKIFDQLDQRTLMGVIAKMKETKAGQIIANMSPDRAKEITDAIAQRRAAKAEGLQPPN